MKHLHFRSALVVAGILALVLAGTALAGKPKTIAPKIGEYTGAARLSSGETGSATRKSSRKAASSSRSPRSRRR
jgi:hypothetical protein